MTFKKTRAKSRSLITEELLHDRNCSVENVDLFSSKHATGYSYTEKYVGKETSDLILISDDEKDSETLVHQENIRLGHILDSKVFNSNGIDGALHPNLEGKLPSEISSLRNTPQALSEGSSPNFDDLPIEKLESDKSEDQLVSMSHLKSKCIDDNETEELSRESGFLDSCPPHNLSDVNLSGETVDLGRTEHSMSQPGCSLKQLSDQSTNLKSNGHKSINVVLPKSEAVINKVVQDNEDDIWEFSFFKSARPQKSFSKPINSAPKRQVIQLNLPVGNRSGLGRVDGQIRRFKAPRLDDWYKPILELDYFATVGLVSADTDVNKAVKKLKEVPVCFKSPDEYVQVFQPLVLEELKAQLNSSFQEMASVEEMCCGSLSVLSVERVDDFHILRCVHEDTDSSGSRSCLEHDLVLLTRQPLTSSPSNIHMVGKVIHFYLIGSFIVLLLCSVDL